MIFLLKLIKNNSNININNYLLTQLIIICFFSIIYYITDLYNNDAETLFENYFDCIYFTIVSHFTVGYGDITPKSKLHKGITMIHIVIAFIISSNLIKINI